MAAGVAELRAAPMTERAPRLEAIDTIVAAAVERHVFPGAVVLAARGQAILHLAAYGATTYGEPRGAPARIDTIYDVASLTKIVTATAALRLWERGLLDLDAPAASYLPRLATRSVTLRIFPQSKATPTTVDRNVLVTLNVMSGRPVSPHSATTFPRCTISPFAAPRGSGVRSKSRLR